MKPRIILSEKDQKIKKRWRISLAIYFVISLLQTYFMFLRLGERYALKGVLYIGVFLLALYSLVYYRSYVRYGYHLLMWILISPFFTLARHASKLKDYFEIQDAMDVVFVILGGLIVNGWWYYTSISLIHLNKRLKSGPITVESKEEMAQVQAGITQMQSAHDLQELDNKFHALMIQFPDFGSALIKEYKKKKKGILKGEKTLEGSPSS